MPISPRLLAVLAVALVLVAIGGRCFRVIPAGHVGVAVLFGSVEDRPYPEGLHFVSPLLSWELFDVRQKTVMEQALIPTRDQLQTSLDVSVQFRIVGSMAPEVLRSTGRPEQMREVHLVPTLRSLVREQGATISKAEDFFNDDTRKRLETGLLRELRARLDPKGFEIQDVLVRDITLPTVLVKAIELKKEREQAVGRQKAELERFRTEQQQKVALADAERQAADQEAARRRILAEALAYEIREINDASASDPAYVQLQALEALKTMAGDPAAKIYFMSRAVTRPVPLLHLGEAP